MELNTKHFGLIDIEEEKTIEFSSGIPGYPELKKFVLMADESGNENTEGYFYWLQSIENADLAFVLVDMIRFNPDYNPLVNENEISDLGQYNPDNFCIYNIAVLPEDINEMTVNLKAPVVINTDAKKGKQVICNNDEYTVRHYMFK